MDDKNFFAVVEKKIHLTIPQRIKTHLKFHNMDNFHMAAYLNEKGIIEIEDFARTTLHQILQPDEIVQFYGSHFQKKPELFVFTLGERMHLNSIKLACEEICKEQEKSQDEYKLRHCGQYKSTENLLKDDDTTQNIGVTNIGRVRRRGGKKQQPAVTEELKQVAPSRIELTTICLRNLPPGTSHKELKNLVKSFGPICYTFLGRDKNSGLCNGFASVDFKSSVHAADAVKALNGRVHKQNLLYVKFCNPKNQRHGSTSA